MRNVAAITLDLDDTLWPIAPVIVAAEQRLGEWFAEHCPRVLEIFRHAQPSLLRKSVMEKHPDRRHDYAFLRRRMIHTMLSESGYTSDLAEPAYQAFFAARNEVQLFDDVPPMLRWLSQHYRLVAVTNGNADLSRMGIDHYFSTTIRAADIGVAKPEPEIFTAAIAAAGVDADRVVHIGDAPVEDMAGAAAAGMYTVWVNRFGHNWPRQQTPPTAQVSTLAELPAVLQQRGF